MYRSNRTPENENISKRFPQPCISAQMLQSVYWGGGGVKRQAFNVIGLRYVKKRVYNIIYLIIKYSKSRKNMKL